MGEVGPCATSHHPPGWARRPQIRRLLRGVAKLRASLAGHGSSFPVGTGQATFQGYWAVASRAWSRAIRVWAAAA